MHQRGVPHGFVPVLYRLAVRGYLARRKTLASFNELVSDDPRHAIHHAGLIGPAGLSGLDDQPVLLSLPDQFFLPYLAVFESHFWVDHVDCLLVTLSPRLACSLLL
jgi:hypothetical protein